MIKWKRVQKKKEKQNKLISDTLDIALGDEIINFSSVSKVGKDAIQNVIKSYVNIWHAFFIE